MKKVLQLIIIFLFTINLSISAKTLYWVNGSGNWNDKNHWSLTSGGNGNVNIPTINDSVIFDDNSNFTKKTIRVNITELAISNYIILNKKVNFTGQYLYTKHLITNISKSNISKVKIISSTKGSFSLTTTHGDNSCHDACDGWIKVTVNGTPSLPYTITWYDGTGTQIATGVDSIYNLCDDNYTVLVEDNDNDIQSQSVNVNNPPAIIVVRADTTDATCNGDCDGKAKVTLITGGTGSLTHSWSNGVTGTNQITNLCPGNYTDTIRDDNGCTKTHSFLISEPPPIVVDSANYTQYICGGGANGEIHIWASGG